MASAGLVGAAYGLLIGRSIDAGRGRRAVVVALSVAIAVVLFRAISLDVSWLVLIANAAGALVAPLYVPVIATVTYNLSKAAPSPFRFNVALEGGWDIGCAAGCFAAAGLIAAGIPYMAILLLPVPALGLLGTLLWRHYPAKVR
jgi:hypothetical protein